MSKTHTHDKQGNPYAKLSKLKAGQTVYLDGGFTCHKSGPVVLYGKKGDLHFACRSRGHNLDGQLASDGKTLIGIYTEQPNV